MENSDSTYYRRKKILQALITALREQFSEDTEIFATDRPRQTAEPMSEFVVVRFAAGMQDCGDTYQMATATINCFVRDESRGLENVDGMQKMLDKACSCFPHHNKLYSASALKMLTGGSDDEMGFHYVTMQSKLIIRK